MTIDANILKELHLERIPQPRYDVPIPRASIEDGTALINHKKAMSCVDVLETAAFERYIPNAIIIDKSLDARVFIPGWSYAICVPTDRPTPVNSKVTTATGITSQINRENHFLELAVCLQRAYDEYAARGMSPPLIWRTSGALGADNRPTIPLLGCSVVFDRRPTDGRSAEDIMNDVGIIAPKEDITPDPEGLENALSS